MLGARLSDTYRLLALLGEGGMGTVYEAIDDRNQRHVAVKLLHPHLRGDATAFARFQREIATCTKLRHPGLVEVLDFSPPGVEPPYFVMELLEGTSLSDKLAIDGALEVGFAASIAVDVLGALEAAHSAGIVHRDVKPSNIVLTRNGDVKLIDFGIAKLLTETAGEKLTRTSSIIGTPAYIAPEQMMPLREVDGRTDVYGLGATLYHAVSGERPFANLFREALIGAVCNLSPTPLTEMRPSIDPAFAAVVERALAKRPDDRFASAQKMADALARFVARPAPTIARALAPPTEPSPGLDVAETHASEPGTHELPFNPDLVQVGSVLFDKFRIERVVGRGGMGVVYAARHLLLDQTVALKVLVDDDGTKETKSRFVNEARIAARIAGEHVCRVLDVAIANDGPAYIVMELLKGKDLDAHLRERGGKLSIVEAVDYALQVLEALAQAHAGGVVHRDLKPSNFFLAETAGGRSVVKVLDFGISKNTGLVKGQSFMTSANMMMGSPAYMAPEQIRQTAAVDARADIWSMGVVLYELLAGEGPFTGASITAVIGKVFNTQPPPIRSKRPEVPEALASAIERCLRKEPAERFPDVQSLATALAPFTSSGNSRLAEIRKAGRNVEDVASPHTVGAPTQRPSGSVIAEDEHTEMMPAKPERPPFYSSGSMPAVAPVPISGSYPRANVTTVTTSSERSTPAREGSRVLPYLLVSGALLVALGIGAAIVFRMRANTIEHAAPATTPIITATVAAAPPVPVVSSAPIDSATATVTSTASDVAPPPSPPPTAIASVRRPPTATAAATGSARAPSPSAKPTSDEDLLDRRH